MKKIMVLFLALALSASPAVAGGYDERLEALEATVQRLVGELTDKDKNIEELQQKVSVLPGESSLQGSREPVISREDVRQVVAEINMEQEASSALSKFSFGGYGEIHANITEGDDADGDSNDQIDIHRFVTYIGYDFADWLKFTSEIEIEHALVSSSDSGELEIEQAYLDFLLNDYVNVRVGRTLVPVGYLNQHHEPTNFNGVERPNFYKAIVPTTWWGDGVGLFGSLGDLSYQVSVLGGLDGSEISSSGIRDSRLKERPSLNDPAYALRLDYTPLASRDLTLRLGTSLYHTGLNNGNKGTDPDLTGDLTIYEADFNLNVKAFDLSGAVAWEEIDGSENLSAGVAEEIFGYYLEAGYHFFPSSWRTGKLAKADAVFFVRYDDYDTQDKMSSGVVGEPTKDRNDWTMGLSFNPVENVVVKADYQILESEGDTDPANTINLGVGWQF
jgi:phosphate-selective porin